MFFFNFHILCITYIIVKDSGPLILKNNVTVYLKLSRPDEKKYNVADTLLIRFKARWKNESVPDFFLKNSE